MSYVSMLSVDPFQWSSIAASVLCGSVIGLERQLRGKPVGIRTSSLIVLGTYLFIVAASTLDSAATDKSRIIGQVVTGIGFLGAGVMMAKDGIVVGVTSAATIWSLAAVGVCIAVVDNLVAIKISVVVIAILYGVDVLEDYSAALTRGVHRKYQGWRGRGGASEE